MLECLVEKDDRQLEDWYKDNRESVTVSFLQWLSEHDQEEHIEVLGRQLTAMSMGLVVGDGTVQQLTEADRNSGAGIGSGTESSVEEDAPEREYAGATTSGRDEGKKGVHDSRIVDVFALGASSPSPSSITSSDPLMSRKLSSESLRLLQQQAAALEATMGVRKAESILHLLGRKQVSSSDEQSMTLIEKDASTRILEVLVQIRDRAQRAVMLAEALIPLSEDDSYLDEEEGEEVLSTTPFVLLQTIDRHLNDESHAEILLQDVNLQLQDQGEEKIEQDHLVNHILPELREDLVSSIESNMSGGMY